MGNSDVIVIGGGLADADFSNTLLQADNGDVLVKTGPGAYGGTPVTQTGAANAINKNNSVSSPLGGNIATTRVSSLAVGSDNVNALLDGSNLKIFTDCLLYTSPSPRDVEESRMPSSA